MDTKKKLYKSQTDKKLAGVCGGLAEFFGFDATWIRIALVVFTLAGGAGILIYIICAIVIPTNPGTVSQDQGYTTYQDASAQNPVQDQTTQTWLCECGAVCNTPFCQQCGRKKPDDNQNNQF